MGHNILIISNTIRGLHSFRKEVIKAIRDKGFDVYISVPDDSPKADYFKEIGCHIIQTPFDRRGMNPFADFKLMLQYRSLMKRIRPVAVLTYTVKPNVYGGIAARLCKIPQLANVTGLGDAVENGGWLKKLTVILYKTGLKKANTVFFQNESNRNYCLKEGIVRGNSFLLPGSGVNLLLHEYQEYPKDEGKTRFLFIARLLKDKGTDEFFETARVIKSKYPDTEFQIVGRVEGDYQKELDELETKGIVSFYGLQMDVRPFLGAVECTIMPSYHEGMSNVNLESAANGRPVITTDVPGCRETVKDGITGYLITPRSSESLINAVERFIALPYNQRVLMGKEARKYVEHHFDRNIVINAYLHAIDAIQ